MDLITAVTEIKSFTDSFNPSTARSSYSRKERRELIKIVECLRLVYFAPGGVTQLLSEISNGRKPDEDMVAAILPYFNDADPFVNHARRALRFDSTGSAFHLPLRIRTVLNDIEYGKGGLRERLQNTLNYALTYGEAVDPKEASILLSEVRALNKSIETAEEALLASLREE